MLSVERRFVGESTPSKSSGSSPIVSLSEKTSLVRYEETFPGLPVSGFLSIVSGLSV